MDRRIIIEVDDHVMRGGADRPKKRNAFDLAMIAELSAACTRFTGR